MKKTLIAGAASLALAAMPVVGAFAADPAAVIDTLTVTVDEACTFNHDGSSGSYTKALEPGELDENFATSTFKSMCNNGKGYTVGVVFTNLAHLDNAGASIVYSATTPTAGSGTWTAQVQGGSNIAASGGVLIDTNTQDPAEGTVAAVVYKVSLRNDQAQGTYRGTATYTLTQKS